MTPLESLSSPYGARIAPSSRTVAALTTMGLLPKTSSLTTMVCCWQDGRKRDYPGIPSVALGSYK